MLGASVSGTAAVELAQRLGHTVRIYDQDPETVVPLEAAGLDTRSGEPTGRMLEDVDLVVTSPGIPEHGEVIQLVLDAGLPLWSEIEFAARQFDVPMAAITGTNGKTTVTVATADMLLASDIPASAVGNVGEPISTAAADDGALVVEASSFQLRFIDTFHPDAAAILNIAPDHLDWHRTMEAYVAAKARITENQVAGDILVLDPDDVLAAEAVRGTKATVVHVSGTHRPSGGNGPDGDRVHIGEHVLPRPELDDTFLFDLVVAGTLAMHLGATPEGVTAVMSRFDTGRHRRELVGSWGGVDWVNDSKATNPHAAATAVRAYASVVLIAGGRNKDLDLAPVVDPPGLRHLVGIGEASAELESLIDAGRFSSAGSMREAVQIAADVARPGDTVLLAPACASFDMFENYGARGDAFVEEAKRVHEHVTGGV